ncbi:lecithin retinol acyltransferase family protein [bacterium]|jgi:hypothetical protein|nr:lecithin retinol acyltransferase family protein [bacterium]
MKPVVRHWKIHCGGFWHHFIDFRRVPKARLHWGYSCVIELVRHGDPNVRRTNFEELIESAGGGKPVLVRELRHNLDEIFDRANSRFRWRRYNVVFNNCEHFANDVMIGRRRSRQVYYRTTQSISSVGMAALAAALSIYPDPPLDLALWTAATFGFSAIMAGDFASFVVRSMMTLKRLERRRLAREANSQATTSSPNTVVA